MLGHNAAVLASFRILAFSARGAAGPKKMVRISRRVTVGLGAPEVDG
jgi:hypothetical protein